MSKSAQYLYDLLFSDDDKFGDITCDINIFKLRSRCKRCAVKFTSRYDRRFKVYISSDICKKCEPEVDRDIEYE